MPAIFVTSATGSQGSHVASQLRQLGITVHATVRNTESPAAQRLAAQGVQLTQGDWDNEAALTNSLAGCDGLFLNLVPAFQTGDVSAERTQAQRILAVAKAAGVQHVIYSSAVSVDRLSKDPLLGADSLVAATLANKAAIEGFVRDAGFKYWTILQGANFMENYLVPKVFMYPALRETKTWTTALTAETQLPCVDCHDIGQFAVAAFRDPARFDQQRIVIAGEFLTPGQIMDRLSAATGHKFKAEFYTEDEIKAQSAVNPFIKAQLVMRTMSNYVDLDAVNSWGIKLNTFDKFLEREKEAVRETYGAV